MRPSLVEALSSGDGRPVGADGCSGGWCRRLTMAIMDHPAATTIQKLMSSVMP